MAGRLAVDFGNSNTVIALWDEVERRAFSLRVPDFAAPNVQEQTVWTIPSLIHYAGNEHWIGNQVLQRNLYNSPRTFRWMKHYISTRNPSRIRVGNNSVTYREAGRAFLSSVLLFAATEIEFSDEEVAFTAPVESFEHYENWLADVATSAGMPRFRLIDEPSAAALGYGTHIQANDIYVVFDFGGGTLDIALILIEEQEKTTQGRRCRVLGKAGEDIGGMVIDQWLFQQILQVHNLRDSDERVRKLSRTLLIECERAKEYLSFHDSATISAMDPDSGALLNANFSREQFEQLLEKRDFLSTIDRALRRALRGAWDKGYTEDDVKAVFMVGGSSFIPCVRHTVQRFFGKERVQHQHPMDAVACGAAAFISGIDFYDHIQHDYAIRYIDPRGDYKYHTIVKRGTPYPSKEPVAKITIKATHEGQQHLGVTIFEVAERHRTTQPVELVFDPLGAARIIDISPEERQNRAYFWMNENNPTFLPCMPPGKKSEPRFITLFSIDNNKRLLITATDMKSGEVVLKNCPVVKLT